MNIYSIIAREGDNRRHSFVMCFHLTAVNLKHRLSPIKPNSTNYYQVWPWLMLQSLLLTVCGDHLKKCKRKLLQETFLCCQR